MSSIVHSPPDRTSPHRASRPSSGAQQRAAELRSLSSASLCPPSSTVHQIERPLTGRPVPPRGRNREQPSCAISALPRCVLHHSTVHQIERSLTGRPSLLGGATESGRAAQSQLCLAVSSIVYSPLDRTSPRAHSPGGVPSLLESATESGLEMCPLRNTFDGVNSIGITFLNVCLKTCGWPLH